MLFYIWHIHEPPPVWSWRAHGKIFKCCDVVFFFFGKSSFFFFFHRPPAFHLWASSDTNCCCCSDRCAHVTRHMADLSCQFPVHSADLPLVPLAMHMYHYAFITSGLGTNCGNLRLVLTPHQWTQDGYWDLSVCTFLPCVFVVLFWVNYLFVRDFIS